MVDNYKLIKSAKERAINRTNNTIEYGVSDVVSKIEITPSDEVYVGDFKDYHYESR